MDGFIVVTIIATSAAAVQIGRTGTPSENSPYILTCDVTVPQSLAMATMTYQWLNNSNALQGQTDSRLLFSPVDRYDNGTYICETTISSSLLNSNIIRQGSTMIQVEGITNFLINENDVTNLPLHAVPLPTRPIMSTTQGTTTISLSWTQPSAGGTVDSYAVQYSASVRGCSDVPILSDMTIGITMRSHTITSLNESSDVSGTITAVNIRGSTSATFTTNTFTASMCHVHIAVSE